MLLLLLLSISSHLSRSTRSVILPLCMVCLLVGDVLLFVCKVYLHAVEHERAAASIVAERACAAEISPHARAQHRATCRRRSGSGGARFLGRRHRESRFSPPER